MIHLLIHLSKDPNVAGYGCLGDLAISFLVVALCWYQVAVSELPAEFRPKSRTPPGLHNPDAVMGMKEGTALLACRDKDGMGLLPLDCS